MYQVACYGPDVLFVHDSNVFLGLSECCVSECSEDIEPGFRLGVEVVFVTLYDLNLIPLSHVTLSLVAVLM